MGRERESRVAVTAGLWGAQGVRERVEGGSDCWLVGAQGVGERVEGSGDCWPVTFRVCAANV